MHWNQGRLLALAGLLAIGLMTLVNGRIDANHDDANWYYDSGKGRSVWMNRWAWMNNPTAGSPNQFDGGGDLNAWDNGYTFYRLAVDSYGKDFCSNTGWVIKWHTGQRSTFNGTSAQASGVAGYNLSCTFGHVNVVDNWFGGYGTSENDWFYSNWACANHDPTGACPHS